MTEEAKLNAIRAVVCRFFSTEPEQMRSKIRRRELVLTRNYIAYFARKNTSLTLREIGNCINRDHADVMHAIRTLTVDIQYNGEKSNHERITALVKSELSLYDLRQWATATGNFMIHGS